MKCSGCGALLTSDDPKCPYCGRENPQAVHKEHLEKLDAIKEDMQELSEQPVMEYKKELKKQVKQISILLFCLAGVAMLLGAYFLINNSLEKQESQEYIREKLQFEAEYFSELNRLYEAGDDAKTAQYLDQLWEKEGAYALFDWSHEPFFYFYHYYTNVKSIKDRLDGGVACSQEEILMATADAVTFYFELYLEERIQELPKEDLKKLEPYQKIVEEYLSWNMRFTEAELERLYEKVALDGMISQKTLRQELEKREGGIKE